MSVSVVAYKSGKIVSGGWDTATKIWDLES